MYSSNPEKPLGYSNTLFRKESGAHYTPPVLSTFVASKIFSACDVANLSGIKLLDPAIGDGELIISMLKEFRKNKIDDKVELFGFDTDFNAIKVATARIQKEFPNVPRRFQNKDFLDYVLEKGRLTLFNQTKNEFDVIIANPPYVRTQILGAKKAQKIAHDFNLSGKIDLYHAFLIGISMILKPGGVAGVITSNRFMTTKSGKNIRRVILDKFDILHVWDLGDTQLFNAAVLPSVLLMRRKESRENSSQSLFTSIYSTNKGDQIDREVENVLENLTEPGIVKSKTGDIYRVRVGRLDHGSTSDGVWRISTDYIERHLLTIQSNTYCKFSDVGNIRVGIKTTADKVFIRSDWNNLPKNTQPELLFPIITHHVAQRYKMIESANPRYVLYPYFSENGKRFVTDLKDYPKTLKYLENNRVFLEGRDYLTAAGRKWYEIWVPQDPNAWNRPKLVFRDISERPTFWLDKEGWIVNGDCYWLAGDKPYVDELMWLALAVGNSKFIEWYYDISFNNKLYSGRRRFMTQYVKQFPLPNPSSSVSKEIIKIAKKAYNYADSNRIKNIEEELDCLIWDAFGLSREEVFWKGNL